MEPTNTNTNTIDIESIENQKENIQPIRSGRSAHQLAALFTKTTTIQQGFNPITLTQQRKQTHDKFQHHIQVLQDALDSKPIKDPHDQLLAKQLILDPLDVYLQYIRWTIEAYPSGGTTGESNLIPLLEQVTRKFMNQERYRQDVRYLKCWLFYSDQVKTTTDSMRLKNPKDTSKSSQLILNFMMHHRIGTNHSLLYLEYFKLFLPLDRLKSLPDDLFKLHQVLKFGVSQTRQDASHERVVELLNQVEAIRVEAQETEKGKSITRPNNTKLATSTIRKTKKKIKVFEDDDSSEKIIDKASPMDDLSATPFSMITGWDSLGTVASNRKQNTLDPSAWKGQKLPMKKLVPSTSSSTAPSTTRSSKIKVFEDHFPDEESTSKSKKEEKACDSPKLGETLQTETDKEENEKPTGFNEDCFALLDDLLRSEIENHMHCYRVDDQGRADDPCEVLRFDPLKFHSL